MRENLSVSENLGLSLELDRKTIAQLTRLLFSCFLKRVASRDAPSVVVFKDMASASFLTRATRQVMLEILTFPWPWTTFEKRKLGQADAQILQLDAFGLSKTKLSLLSQWNSRMRY